MTSCVNRQTFTSDRSLLCGVRQSQSAW